MGYDKKHISFYKKFRLSNKERDYLNFISSQFKLLKYISYDDKIIKKQIYFYKKNLTQDLLNFIFFSTKKINYKNFNKYKLFIKKFRVPIFPISGNFLIRRGFRQGESLGKKLKLLKNFWINSNFKLNLSKI